MFVSTSQDGPHRTLTTSPPLGYLCELAGWLKAKLPEKSAPPKVCNQELEGLTSPRTLRRTMAGRSETR